MIVNENENQRNKKRSLKRRKRRRALQDSGSAFLSPINLPSQEKIAPPKEEIPSFIEKLFRLLVGNTQNPNQERALSPALDPMRTILAIPDGIGRLEAFKEMLQQIPPTSYYYRSIALSFRRHIMDLLEEAQLPPASIEHHLQPCIDALKEVGLEEDAQILSDLPPFEPYIPKQIYLNAYERSELDAIDKEIAFTAKTAFRDFEIEMLKNNRTLALQHLQKAIRQAPGHPEYQVAFQQMEQKKTTPFQLELKNAAQQIKICSGQQFIWGRDQNAHLRFLDPQVSREHALFSFAGPSQWALTQLEQHLPVFLNDEPWQTGLLPSSGTLRLHHHDVAFQIMEKGIVLRPHRQPHQTLFFTIEEHFFVPFTPQENILALNFFFEESGCAYLVPTQQTFFNDEEMKRRIYLLVGDSVSNPTQAWQIIKNDN